VWSLKSVLSFGILFFVGCACESAKDLTTFDFDSTIDFPLSITESQAGTGIQYSSTVVLDAAAMDPEIQKYAANIEGIAVEDLSFSITEFFTSAKGDIYLTDGSMGFGKKNAINPASSCQVDNLPISHWAGTSPFKIAACDNTLADIANALSADRSVRVFLEGTLNKAPVSFKLNIKLKLKVTARPL
jgi:hypothetical protein